MKSIVRKISFFWEDYSGYIKAVAIILLIGVAAFLFFINGDKDDSLKISKDIKSVIESDDYLNKERQNEEKDSNGKIKDKSKKGFNKLKNGNKINNTEDLEEKSLMYVDIEGEVLRPGVYKINDGDRVFQVIAQAGGLTEEADLNTINKAEVVTDGQKIHIYKKGEVADCGKGGSSAGEYGGKININQADESKLQDIPGVGPSMASRIVEYRKTNGRFNTIDDLKNVSGIGDKRFESMKDMVTI